MLSLTVLEKLKFIKRQPQDRHIDIYLGGKNYLDNLLIEYKDKYNNKNELIDLLLDTAIKYLEDKERQ